LKKLKKNFKETVELYLEDQPKIKKSLLTEAPLDEKVFWKKA